MRRPNRPGHEGTAATIAYVHGRKPGATFKQWQKSAEKDTCNESMGKANDDSSYVSRKKRQRHRWKKKIPVSECSGHCCLRCGKQGHFIRDCTAPGRCLFVSDPPMPCEDTTHSQCQCACGQHDHFVSASDREAILLAAAPTTKKK